MLNLYKPTCPPSFVVSECASVADRDADTGSGNAGWMHLPLSFSSLEFTNYLYLNPFADVLRCSKIKSVKQLI